MKDPVKLLKLGWKSGAAILTATTLFVGGLVLNLNAVNATNPNLTLKYLGINNSGGNWGHNVDIAAGEVMTLYAEIHNTNVPTTANDVSIRVHLPGTTGNSRADVTALNAPGVSDNVQINVAGGNLEYVSGSTRMTWDVNGDGNKEFDNTLMPDGITQTGLTLGDQQGCNEFIIQISFLARVVEKPKPSPSPRPSPSPTPSPSPLPSPTPPPTGGDVNVDVDVDNDNDNSNENENNNENNNEQDQSQNQDVDVNQENNQTVNITTNIPPAVAGAKVPLKQPETGVSVLGTVSMASAAPVGFALSRFGRGRVIARKKEENLSELASNLVEGRVKSTK